MRKELIQALVFAAGLAIAVSAEAAAIDQHQIRAEIQSAINKSIEATRTKNIDAFMEGIPPDFQVKRDDGSIMDRNGLKTDVLQQWSIIDRTVSISMNIDKIEIINPNEANVWTSQRWDRKMRGRDGKSLHDVLSTEKHKEHWKRHDGRWYSYDIEELGGKIWVDGKPFNDQAK